MGDSGQMKVCMVSGIFPPDIGGPATQASALCDVLWKHGIASVVLTYGSRTGVETRGGIKVYRVRRHYPAGAAGELFRQLVFIRHLVRILRRERPQVVHCHDCHLHSLLAGLLARLLGVATVAKFTGDVVWEKANRRALRAASISAAHRLNWRFRLLGWIERQVLHRFDVVCAASESRRNDLRETLGIDPGKICVLPNYIPLPGRRPENGADGCGSDFLYIVSAGRFAPHKRLDVTLQALAALGRPHVRLRLIGGGDELEEKQVAALIEKLGVQDRVIRLGNLPYCELIRTMESSHILLSTSEEEGFGIVFVEAMAAGLPVIAMRTGGIPEVVPDGQAGFLIEPGNVPLIVEKLRVLLDDPALRRQLAVYGKAYARRFDLEEHWEAFVDLYQRAMMVRRQRPHAESGGSLQSKP